MSQFWSRRTRSPAWALPALLIGPVAWSDGTGDRVPPAAIEDRGPAHSVTRPRAAAQQWSIGEPTGEEQQLLELMNRARLNPAAEGDRIFADYDSARVKQAVDFFLNQRPAVEFTRAENRAAFRGYAAKAPFAFSSHLIVSARGHSALMKQYDQQSHQIVDSKGNLLLDGMGNPVEKGLRARLEDAGYSGTSLAESVFAYADDMVHAHAGFAIDYGQGVPQGNARPSLGHRLNLMGFDGDPARSYAEVGIGVVDDSNAATQVGPKLVTIDFAIPANDPYTFVTGVCWDDTNGNGFYDPGEGIGGVRIDLDVGSYFAISSASGGYAVPVIGAPGTIHVTATGTGTVIGTQTVAVSSAGANVKADFTRATAPPLPAFVELFLAVPVTLANGGSVSAALDATVPAGASPLLGDIEIEVAIDHPERAELTVTLVAPDATEIVLFDHGPSGVNLNGVFDSSLAPRQPFDPLIGQTYAGTWRLRVDDAGAGNSGTLTGWKLRLRPQAGRAVFVHASPLFVTKLKVKAGAAPGADSITFAAQVDPEGTVLDTAAPCSLRLLGADAMHAELLRVSIPAAGITYALGGTSRTIATAKITLFDLSAPLPGVVEAELAIGGAIVRETIPLVKGAFAATTKLPSSALFHVDSLTTKIVLGVPNYTVKGRLAAAVPIVGTGTCDVVLGAFMVSEAASAFVVKGAKATYKGRAGLKKLTVDALKGSFTLTIATNAPVRSGAALDLMLRLGDGGFLGATKIVPKESGSSLTY